MKKFLGDQLPGLLFGVPLGVVAFAFATRLSVPILAVVPVVVVLPIVATTLHAKRAPAGGL